MNFSKTNHFRNSVSRSWVLVLAWLLVLSTTPACDDSDEDTQSTTVKITITKAAVIKLGIFKHNDEQRGISYANTGCPDTAVAKIGLKFFAGGKAGCCTSGVHWEEIGPEDWGFMTREDFLHLMILNPKACIPAADTFTWTVAIEPGQRFDEFVSGFIEIETLDEIVPEFRKSFDLNLSQDGQTFSLTIKEDDIEAQVTAPPQFPAKAASCYNNIDNITTPPPDCME